MNEPSSRTWIAVKRVLRYVRVTIDTGLRFRMDPDGTYPTLIGYSDSDWATDTDSRKSVSGYALFLANGMIHGGRKSQTVVSCSTIQAELIALHNATNECVWIRRLLADLGFQQSEPTTIFVDNPVTMTMVSKQYRYQMLVNP